MNEYLRTLVKLIEAQGIDDSANLVIIANEGDPATVQVSQGRSLQFFVESEDQSKLILKATCEL